jgi:hypothetical protein
MLKVVEGSSQTERILGAAGFTYNKVDSLLEGHDASETILDSSSAWIHPMMKALQGIFQRTCAERYRRAFSPMVMNERSVSTEFRPDTGASTGPSADGSTTRTRGTAVLR